MNFKNLESLDIPIIKNYLLKTNPELSTYSLPSLFLWDECIYKYRITQLDSFLIVLEESIDKKEKTRILLPLPYSDLKVEKLVEIMKITNQKYIFYVPESYIQKNPDLNKFFNISPQSEFNDYIYLTDKLSELNGSKYSGKRNLINQFLKNYEGSFEIKNITKQNIEDIIYLSQKTYSQTDKTSAIEFLECEKKAILNIKKFFEYIEFKGISVYINGEIKAFAIGSELNRETFLCNFEKADKTIKGLYQFIDREFAKILKDKYKYINKESDLGKESLKKAKLSYHPIFLIKSYILELKKDY